MRGLLYGVPAICMGLSVSIGAAVAQSLGPQTPRDITSAKGTNPSAFAVAPSPNKLNLCNLHFHTGAEHRGPGFMNPVGTAKAATGAHVPHAVASSGTSGHGHEHGAGAAGFECKDTARLTPAQLQPIQGDVCGGLQPGTTIEVHWVHTSCATGPGAGLGSCAPAHCKNPTLRVEAQVFLLVNDRSALDFRKFDYAGAPEAGRMHQAKALPAARGAAVFRGSTTGPSASAGSPFEATWSVRPQCARLDIESLRDWCANNVFKENHGHGVRPLVTAPEQLSQIANAPIVVSDAGASSHTTGRRPLSRRFCPGERNFWNAEIGKCDTK